MDLSKAFDCLPHDILLSKLSAYGLTENSIKLLYSYLSDRKQQIKIGNIVSMWGKSSKKVPRGSIHEPLLFNVFINDIFYFIHKSNLYNYADDNTLSFHSPDYEKVISVLQEESDILIKWFSFNCLQANPEKCQVIAVGKNTCDKNPIFNLGDANISCDEIVKLLGVDIDFKRNFGYHITNIYKKAVQQLNILKRIGKNLSKLNRLTIFHTFILPNFNFCPLSWHFCSEKNTKMIERVQERALRFVYFDNTSSYDELLVKVKLLSLHVRRTRLMAIATFKGVNSLFRQPISPTTHYYDSPFLRQPIIPTVHYSDNDKYLH
jgi:hypothetical protein